MTSFLKLFRHLALPVILVCGCGESIPGVMLEPVQTARVVEGIEGTVTDSGGRAVGEAFVGAEAISNPRPAVPEIAIVTDRSGRYFWRLSPAEYAITVSAPGFRKITKRARVEGGKRVTLDFQLERDR